MEICSEHIFGLVFSTFRSSAGLKLITRERSPDIPLRRRNHDEHRQLPLICPPHHLQKATRLAELFSKNASSTSPIRFRALVSALQGVLLSHAD